MINIVGEAEKKPYEPDLDNTSVISADNIIYRDNPRDFRHVDRAGEENGPDFSIQPFLFSTQLFRSKMETVNCFSAY